MRKRAEPGRNLSIAFALALLTGACGQPADRADAGVDATAATGGQTATGGNVGTGGAAGRIGAGGQAGGVPGQGGSGGGGGAAGVGGRGTAGAGGGAGHGTAGAAGSPSTGGRGGAAGMSGGGGRPASADGGAGLPKLTVWIAGDSTVANNSGTPCPVGWGVDFASYFNKQVTVVNSAVGGRSVRTWLYDVQSTMDSSGECVLSKDASGNLVLQGHWQAMLDGMKPGDVLFIQFGINDTDSTCPRHVGTTAFEQSYAYMAKAAKDRGAQPVFVTPVSSISCTGTTAVATRGRFAAATKDAGTQDSVPVIDLETLSVALYNQSGFCPIPGGGDVSASTGGAVGAFFCDDHTHFSSTGAPRIAGLVAEAVRTLKLPLAAYLTN